MGSPSIQQVDCHSPQSGGREPLPERRRFESPRDAEAPQDADGYLGSVEAPGLNTYNEFAYHSALWVDRVLGTDQLDFVLSSVIFS